MKTLTIITATLSTLLFITALLTLRYDQNLISNWCIALGVLAFCAAIYGFAILIKRVETDTVTSVAGATNIHPGVRLQVEYKDLLDTLSKVKRAGMGYTVVRAEPRQLYQKVQLTDIYLVTIVVPGTENDMSKTFKERQPYSKAPDRKVIFSETTNAPKTWFGKTTQTQNLPKGTPNVKSEFFSPDRKWAYFESNTPNYPDDRHIHYIGGQGFGKSELQDKIVEEIKKRYPDAKFVTYKGEVSEQGPERVISISGNALRAPVDCASLIDRMSAYITPVSKLKDMQAAGPVTPEEIYELTTKWREAMHREVGDYSKRLQDLYDSFTTEVSVVTEKDLEYLIKERGSKATGRIARQGLSVKNYNAGNWPADAPPYWSPEGWEYEKALKLKHLKAQVTISWLYKRGSDNAIIVADRLTEILGV